jgi:L-gulonolactone oxidase
MAAPDLAARYPRFEEFGAVRARVDPAGTFAGAHLTRVLGPVSGHRVVV